MILNEFCELSYLFQGYFTWLVFPIHIQIIAYSLVHLDSLSILIPSFYYIQQLTKFYKTLTLNLTFWVYIH